MASRADGMFEVQLKLFGSSDADECSLLRKSAKTEIDQISTLTSLTSVVDQLQRRVSTSICIWTCVGIDLDGKAIAPRGN